VLTWIGLSLVWHIPSISIELAFHHYNGMYAAMVSLLVPQEKYLKVLTDPKFIESNDLGRVINKKDKP